MMTKRYIHIVTACLLFAAGLLAATGCRKPGPDNPDDSGKIKVTGVAISPTTLTLTPGIESSVTVTLTPADATEQRVRLTSSNSEVLLLGEEKARTVTLNPGEIPVLAMAAGTATIDISTLDGGFKGSCSVTVRDNAVRITKITLSPSQLSMRTSDTPVQLTAAITPADATEKGLFWMSSNPSVATVSDGLVTAAGDGEAVISAVARDGSGVRGTCRVVVEEDLMAVDLGLDVLWANVNVGATVSSECGDYFAWGETVSKTQYNWDTYAFGTEPALTKYTAAGPVVLEMDDDAARKVLGGRWRMPTLKDMNDLRNLCSWSWSNRGGQNGFLVTGKNGKSIFLPAAGIFLGDYPPKTGKEGNYWVSSLYTGVPSRAWMLSFTASEAKTTYSDRCYGYSVRAVMDKQ